MIVDLTLAGFVTLALLAVIIAAALGVADFHVRVAETDSTVERLRAGEVPVVGDEIGDDVVAMLAAWQREAAS